jgi:hypothetical protein
VGKVAPGLGRAQRTLVRSLLPLPPFPPVETDSVFNLFLLWSSPSSQMLSHRSPTAFLSQLELFSSVPSTLFGFESSPFLPFSATPLHRLCPRPVDVGLLLSSPSPSYYPMHHTDVKHIPPIQKEWADEAQLVAVRFERDDPEDPTCGWSGARRCRGALSFYI